MKTIRDAAAREDILGRLASLEEDAARAWGSMTPGAMLFHLNAAMSMALGEIRPEHVGNPAFWHTTGKAIALGEEPWPEGAPTFREALPDGPVDLEAERARFRLLLDRLVARDEDADWPDHARLGPMTGAEWSRFTYTHTQHHFRQFGI